MATDGPDPTPCDPKLFKQGVTVAMCATYGANHFETLIKQVREDTGRPVDWHYVGGRANVLAFLKDAPVVKEAFERIVRPVLAAKHEETMQAIHVADDPTKTR